MNTSKFGILGLFTASVTACSGPQGPVDTSAAAPNPPAVAQVEPPKPVDPVLLRCQERLAKAKDLRQQMVDLAASATADTGKVLNAYNLLSIEVDNADAESGLTQAVHPEKATRDAASECEKLVAAFKTEFSLDRKVYDAFVAIKVDGQPADVKRIVAKNLEDFRRAGVDKDEGTRGKIRALNEKLTALGQQFDKEIFGDTKFVELDVAQLKGLPQDWIDAHKPCALPQDPTADKAAKCTAGKVKVTTSYPDYIPFMSYADDDAARKQLYTVYRQRAWPANQANLDALLQARFELANLLGYKNWADYITGNKMIKNEKNVSEFIERITKASEKRMKAEYAILLAELQKTDKAAKDVSDWQSAYLLGKVKKSKYAFDAQSLRPYLHYDKVKSGLLALTSKLFNITYKPNATAPRWDTSVEAYDVFEGDKQYGTIYLDMHPRPNKYNHAAQFVLLNGVLGHQLPVGVLVCNFPDPKSGNGLMEHKDVETFFHEFGHLIHHVFGGHQKWSRFSGVATEWDFVEAPSQIFEEWSKDYETLKAFATDDKGAVVPKDLVDKLKASDDFGKGLWVRHQMFYASVSLGLHNRDPKGLNQDALIAEIMNKYSAYHFVPDTHMQASFGHLNGYSAIYYTYMWSMVIAKDMFSAFIKTGILNPATALKYRKTILEPGGSKDAADLVADFLGRPYNFQSYEDWLNQKKK